MLCVGLRRGLDLVVKLDWICELGEIKNTFV